LDIFKCLNGITGIKKTKNVLKSSEISNISDDSLLFEMISWIRRYIGDDWDNQDTNACEDILELPHPCQFVYSCCAVIEEVSNGGFNQLYFNTTALLAGIAQEGFLEIGAEKLAEVMRQADVIFNKIRLTLLPSAWCTIESFADSYDQHVFHTLDQIFCDEVESCCFDNLLVSYIRKHETCFGE